MRDIRTVAAAALVAAAATAFADLEVEVGNGDFVAGTLAPADEVETVRAFVPRGATLSVRAKGARKGPLLAVRILDPEGGQIAAGDGRKVALTAPAVAASGSYAIEVRSSDAATSGDYALSVKWKPRAAWPIAGTLAANGELIVPFAADAGAKATISVKGTGRPATAVPSVRELTDPSSEVTPFTGRTRVLGAGGDWSLRIADTGGVGGPVKGSIKVKAGRRTARKLLLNAKTIGAGGVAGDAAYATIVGAGGGTVEVPLGLPLGDPGLAIAGASVTIPPGALPVGTPIVIATAPPILRDDLEPAGPTVYLGPEGLRFETPVTVTIPLDGSYDLATIRVYTRDARGRLTLVDPVDPGYTLSAGTLSFPVSHFSSFRAFTTEPPPEPRLVSVFFQSGITDVCAANDPATTGTRNHYYVAEGSRFRVGALQASSSLPASYTHVTWAGEGNSTADGTDRLSFQFLGAVQGVETQADGTLFVATSNQIFRIATTGEVTLFAGTGAQGDSGDDGDAKLATFIAIDNILVAADGTVYVADPGFGAHRIRVISPSDGKIRAWAGVSSNGGLGADGGDPATTTFFGPRGLAFAPAGGLYVSDNNRIRRIDPSADPPVNVTVAGDTAGNPGSSLSGGRPLETFFTATQGIGAFVPASGPPGDAILVTCFDATLWLVDFANDRCTRLAGVANSFGYQGDDVAAPSLLLGPLEVVGEANRYTMIDGARVRQYRLR